MDRNRVEMEGQLGEAPRKILFRRWELPETDDEEFWTRTQLAGTDPMTRGDVINAFDNAGDIAVTIAFNIRQYRAKGLMPPPELREIANLARKIEVKAKALLSPF